MIPAVSYLNNCDLNTLIVIINTAEAKIQDDLRLDQECYPETEVESFMLEALVSDLLLLFQLLVAYEIAFSYATTLVTTTFSNSRGGRLRELRLYL